MGRDRTRLERLENLQNSFSVLTPTLNYVIVADGITFNSVPLTGDATITSAGALTVTQIRGHLLGDTTPNTGAVLLGDGARWNSIALIGDITVTDGIGTVLVTQINGVPLGVTTDTAGNLLIAQGGTGWRSRAVSGDITLSSLGVTTIGTNKVTNAKAAQMAAVSVKVNATNVLANASDLATTGGSNAMLMESGGGALVWGLIGSANFNANVVTNAVFRQSAARSVVGVTGNATANVADIQGTADQVLAVNTAGTALTFTTVATGGITANAVTNAKLAQMAAKTFKGNNTAGTANALDLTLDLCRAALDPADYAGSTTGTGTYTATLTPTPVAYTSGQQYNLIFTSTNTTATPTVNLNSLGAKTLKKDGATLGIGQIRGGAVHTATYDGTDMQLTSPMPGPVLLACIIGINLKTVANTALYTVPAGKTCLITQALVNCTAATAITVAATAGVGVASGDIYAAVVLTGLTATTKCWGWSTQGLIVNVAAASVINFNVTGAATGTSQTADVYLYGQLF
jgi:hypothetical protein